MLILMMMQLSSFNKIFLQEHFLMNLFNTRMAFFNINTDILNMTYVTKSQSNLKNCLTMPLFNDLK